MDINVVPQQARSGRVRARFDSGDVAGGPLFGKIFGRFGATGVLVRHGIGSSFVHAALADANGVGIALTATTVRAVDGDSIMVDADALTIPDSPDYLELVLIG